MAGSKNLVEQGIIRRQDSVAAVYVINRAGNHVAVSFEEGALVTFDLKSVAHYTGLTSQIVEYINGMILPASPQITGQPDTKEKSPDNSNGNVSGGRHDCECGKWCMCTRCLCGVKSEPL
jgi:hypothetical protein